jgi:hypothetical protein
LAFSNIDRSQDIENSNSEFLVKSTDYCRYFEIHPYTILQRNECWTCKYSNFAMETGSFTDTGLCRYHIISK